MDVVQPAAAPANAEVDLPYDPAEPLDRMRVRSARWLMTVNNPGDWAPFFVPDQMHYLVWQRERAPTTGTPHVQGYVRFKVKKTRAAVKRLFNHEMDLRICRGNEEQCRRYCTKEDTREAVGGEQGDYKPEEGKQGRRTDLEQIAASIERGASIKEVATDHPADFIRYHQGIERFAAVVRPPPPIQRQLEVIVLWGPTGTGKTHRIMNAFPECFCVRPGRDPWDGYVDQETIFFDEFEPAEWPINQMKLILDKWRLRLNARYHNVFAAWTRVAICCNTNPTAWYEHAAEVDLLAIRRRICSSCRYVEEKEPPMGEGLPLQSLMLAPPSPAF